MASSSCCYSPRRAPAVAVALLLFLLAGAADGVKSDPSCNHNVQLVIYNYYNYSSLHFNPTPGDHRS